MYNNIYTALHSNVQSTKLALTFETHFSFGMAINAFRKIALHMDFRFDVSATFSIKYTYSRKNRLPQNKINTEGRYIFIHFINNIYVYIYIYYRKPYNSCMASHSLTCRIHELQISYYFLEGILSFGSGQIAILFDKHRMKKCRSSCKITVGNMALIEIVLNCDFILEIL